MHKFGHVPELLITFGPSSMLVEPAQLVWGRIAVDYRVPEALKGPLSALYGTWFSMYRGFMMAVALLRLVAIWLLL